MSTRTAALMMLALSISIGCSAGNGKGPSAGRDRLAPCPDSPNCVCSDDGDGRSEIAPIRLRVDVPDAWNRVRETVAAMPRTRIVTFDESYLHAEQTSALFRFVDDLELSLRAGADDREGGVIAVRSASRVGYSDLGVNRRRVEKLRAELIEAGIAEPTG